MLAALYIYGSRFIRFHLRAFRDAPRITTRCVPRDSKFCDRRDDRLRIIFFLFFQMEVSPARTSSTFLIDVLDSRSNRSAKYDSVSLLEISTLLWKRKLTSSYLCFVENASGCRTIDREGSLVLYVDRNSSMMLRVDRDAS